ncbi:MFS transporter [Cellulosimicrobium cellulans]|uniref:MFS transporter n=1 Tax=Cellulosimicrobium cellulans TaxID=1710 RepID=UPI0020CEC2CE|nr:MFS transporter [Cellulosimicrobium cellulans]
MSPAQVEKAGALAAPVPVVRDEGNPRMFWALTLATATSKLGNQFLLIAVPVLVLQITGSAASAVLAAAAQNLPFLFGPLVGPVVDRFSRRTIFIVSEVASAAVVAMIPLFIHGGGSSLPLVYLSVFCVGTLSVASSLTNEYTFVPSLLGEGEERTRLAYARYNGTLDVARFVGPLVAGALIATVGASLALWIDAATFLGTALVALWLPKGGRIDTSEPFFRSIRLGWRTFRTIPRLGLLTVVLALYNLGVGSIAVYFVAVASGAWGWSSLLVGGVISMGSLASAAGAWVGRRVLAGSSTLRRIHFWLGASAVAALLMPLGLEWVVSIGFLAMSFCAGAFNVETLTWRRAVIPREFAGRVNSIVRFFVAGAIPGSALVLSFVADGTPLVRFLPVTVAAVLAAMVWTVALRRQVRSG